MIRTILILTCVTLLGGCSGMMRTCRRWVDTTSPRQRIAMAYFTTETRNQPWVREVSDPGAPEHSWYQIFAAGKVPANFPLTHGRFIAGTDQFLLADRPRW